MSCSTCSLASHPVPFLPFVAPRDRHVVRALQLKVCCREKVSASPAKVKGVTRSVVATSLLNCCADISFGSGLEGCLRRYLFWLKRSQDTSRVKGCPKRGKGRDRQMQPAIALLTPRQGISMPCVICCMTGLAFTALAGSWCMSVRLLRGEFKDPCRAFDFSNLGDVA